MILLDTNVIVSLLDISEPLSGRARATLRKLERQSLAVIPAVLTEALFFLHSSRSRLALREWLAHGNITRLDTIEEGDHEAEVIDWLLRYADHEPDYADGCLCVLSNLLPKAKVWTYDSEFSTIWRRPDGSRVPLVSG
ncbi:MAG: PIN domain-containing protein [Deltaproteobacteria bacterium]|nr:PIN domain-containing protein [Deltaproteobacteria bacterium]